MKELHAKNDKLAKRKRRVRGKISGTRRIPRLAVSKTNTSLYCQLVDDVSGQTLLGLHSNHITSSTVNMDTAYTLGQEVAKKAQEKHIFRVVFDRRGRKYTGRVAAVAHGARDIGLKI